MICCISCKIDENDVFCYLTAPLKTVTSPFSETNFTRSTIFELSKQCRIDRQVATSLPRMIYLFSKIFCFINEILVQNNVNLIHNVPNRFLVKTSLEMMSLCYITQRNSCSQPNKLLSVLNY